LIKLYESIKYQNKDLFSNVSDGGAPDCERKGWYYYGKRYYFNNNPDIDYETGYALKEPLKDKKLDKITERTYQLKLLQKLNRQELKKLMKRLYRWQIESADFVVIPAYIQERVDFLEFVRRKFIKWYKLKKLRFPSFGKPSIRIDEKGEVKISWKHSKGEFAVMIIEEYEANPEGYKSKNDCARKMFNNYEFPEELSEKDCINNVKQQHILRLKTG
jgi:hypothetical protein